MPKPTRYQHFIDPPQGSEPPRVAHFRRLSEAFIVANLLQAFDRKGQPSEVSLLAIQDLGRTPK
jgi:hypothetical protein